jgi:hypothetical protein
VYPFTNCIAVYQWLRKNIEEFVLVLDVVTRYPELAQGWTTEGLLVFLQNLHKYASFPKNSAAANSRHEGCKDNCVGAQWEVKPTRQNPPLLLEQNNDNDQSTIGSDCCPSKCL